MGEHSKGGRGSGGQSRPYRGGHTGRGGSHESKGCAVLALALASVPVGILAAAATLVHWALS